MRVRNRTGFSAFGLTDREILPVVPENHLV